MLIQLCSHHQDFIAIRYSSFLAFLSQSSSSSITTSKGLLFAGNARKPHEMLGDRPVGQWLLFCPLKCRCFLGRCTAMDGGKNTVRIIAAPGSGGNDPKAWFDATGLIFARQKKVWKKEQKQGLDHACKSIQIIHFIYHLVTYLICFCICWFLTLLRLTTVKGRLLHSAVYYSQLDLQTQSWQWQRTREKLE